MFIREQQLLQTDAVGNQNDEYDNEEGNKLP